VDKLKEYFTGFMDTFIACYIASENALMGHMQLNSEHWNTETVSKLASLAPLFGEICQRNTFGVILSDAWRMNKMDDRARRLIQLGDTLSNMKKVVGNIILKVLQAEKVRMTLLDADWKFQKGGSSLIKRLGDWFNGVGRYVSKDFIKQYSSRYETDHRKLGNYHAEVIIEIWLKGEMRKEETEWMFVERLLADYKSYQPVKATPVQGVVNQTVEEKKAVETNVGNTVVNNNVEKVEANPKKSACCNIF